MNRRSILKGIFFISSIFTFRVSASKKNNISFDYGVASGDPTNSNVILWTRVTSSLNKDIKIEIKSLAGKILNKSLRFNN